MAKNPLTDAELDMLLKQAAVPDLPPGFADRFQAQLDASVRSNVIAFPQKKSPPAKSANLWLSTIPLAASLAIGVYLGAQGILADSLSNLNISNVADATDSLFNIGIEDTELFVNGELS